MKKRILSVLLVLVLVVGILPIGVSAAENQGEYISVDYRTADLFKIDLTIQVKNTEGDLLETFRFSDALRSGSTMAISLNSAYYGIYELDNITIEKGDISEWSESFNDSYQSTFTWSNIHYVRDQSDTITITLKEAEHTLKLTNGSLDIGTIAYKEGLQRTNVNVFLNYEPFVSFKDVGIANTLNNFILTLEEGYYYGDADNSMDYSSEIPGQTITYEVGDGDGIYNKLTFGVLSSSVYYQNELNTINLYMFTYDDGIEVDFTRAINGNMADVNLDNACTDFNVAFQYDGIGYDFTYDKWDQTHKLYLPRNTLIYVDPEIKEGYQFDYWKTSDAFGDHANSLFTILEDGTLHEETGGSTIEGVYAYSQKMAFRYASGYSQGEIILGMVDNNAPAYTITYHSNNGTDQTKAEKFYTGAYIDKNTFEYEGHSFVNWNTKSDGTGTAYNEHDFYNDKANLDLYAQWKSETEEPEPEPEPELKDGKPVTLQVYLDGKAVKNPMDYVALSRVSEDEAKKFEPSVDNSNGVVTINYNYEQYDCVDIKVGIKSNVDNTLLQGVRAYHSYGEKGTGNVIDNPGGTYTIDNACADGDNSSADVEIYLNTKYSVEYYQDGTELTGNGYDDNKVYITSKKVANTDEPSIINDDTNKTGWLDWKMTTATAIRPRSPSPICPPSRALRKSPAGMSMVRLESYMGKRLPWLSQRSFPETVIQSNSTR